jgi:hypothetical protein
MKGQMIKSKPLNNFQESTIEEIHNILHTIKDGQSWKKSMQTIHRITEKDNIC